MSVADQDGLTVVVRSGVDDLDGRFRRSDEMTEWLIRLKQNVFRSRQDEHATQRHDNQLPRFVLRSFGTQRCDNGTKNCCGRSESNRFVPVRV